MSQTADVIGESSDSSQRGSPEDLVFELFKLPQQQENASIGKLISVLRSLGLQADDPRLAKMMQKINEVEAQEKMNKNREHHCTVGCLPHEHFKSCVHPCIALITRALWNQLIIPNWSDFTIKIREIFDECRTDKKGEVATYIPQLARTDSEKWGMAICTIDGQRFALGDSRVPWCFQSVSKAFTYAIVASDLGEYVHSFVGHEPSGRFFNEICLDAGAKPHNPMINSGAIIVTSLLRKGEPMADRYDFHLQPAHSLLLMDKGRRQILLLSEVKPDSEEFLNQLQAFATRTVRRTIREIEDEFSRLQYLPSAEASPEFIRNYALSYYMKENKCFPPDIESIHDELDLYFQICSLETDCENAAVMASCGMYDYSGQFAFHVGLPAKSGVSGGLVVVVPNLMGICLFSPRLDNTGNSSRGVLFCKKLVDKFSFYNYDSLLHAESKKIDPRRLFRNKETDLIVNLLFACENGDLDTVKKLFLQGAKLNIADYDGRTALHLAASEGNITVLKFLLNEANVDSAIRDRWERTALDDARTLHRTSCVPILLKAAQKQHKEQRKMTQQRQNA